jgi:hypothetical protein
MELELVKQYKRNTKHFFVVDIVNDGEEVFSGPELRGRPRWLVLPDGTEVRKPGDDGLVPVDFEEIGPGKTTFKFTVDTAESLLFDEPGDYTVMLGIVKERVSWWCYLELYVQLG